MPSQKQTGSSPVTVVLVDGVVIAAMAWTFKLSPHHIAIVVGTHFGPDRPRGRLAASVARRNFKRLVDLGLGHAYSLALFCSKPQLWGSQGPGTRNYAGGLFRLAPVQIGDDPHRYFAFAEVR